MREFNDNLIPLLFQPLILLRLFLAVYFVNRFVTFVRTRGRLARVFIALAITIVIYFIGSFFVDWGKVALSETGSVILWLFMLLLLNVLSSIWYKPKVK